MGAFSPIRRWLLGHRNTACTRSLVIAEAEAPRPVPSHERGRRGRLEWAAIALIVCCTWFGVVFFGAAAVLAWPVGVVLLWRSRIWNVRDKLIGTLLIPVVSSLSYLIWRARLPLYFVKYERRDQSRRVV
jgi:hypothetical protein